MNDTKEPPRPTGNALQGLSPLAIIVGGVSDIALSTLLGIGFALYVVMTRPLITGTRDQVQNALLAAIHASPSLQALQMGIGLVCSVAGGYIAASIAKQRRLLNGVLACWLCLGIGFFSQLPDFSTAELVRRAVLILLTPLCYLAGAYLRTRRLPAPRPA